MTDAEINRAHAMLNGICMFEGHGLLCNKCGSHKSNHHIPNYLADGNYAWKLVGCFNVCIIQDCDNVRACARKHNYMGICEIEGWTLENIKRAVLTAVLRMFKKAKECE